MTGQSDIDHIHFLMLVGWLIVVASSVVIQETWDYVRNALYGGGVLRHLNIYLSDFPISFCMKLYLMFQTIFFYLRMTYFSIVVA